MMEWVETTAKTVDAAKDAALDQLGVAADEAEFELLDEPKAGLFGRVRGEARVRARVKPTPVRPKQERRRRSNGRKKGKGAETGSAEASSGDTVTEDAPSTAGVASTEDAAPSARTASTAASSRQGSNGGGGRNRNRSRNRQAADQAQQATNDTSHTNQGDQHMSNDTIDHEESDVSPQEVGDAAVAFMDGLVAAFGAEATTELEIDGTELDVRVQGEGLGLMVGRGGRTLNAVQDLARVAAQRRLGDHETRLRIDVARYRERRSEALVRFAADVAEQVRSSGSARSLEPMSSADRKVIHDALNDEEGVASSSEGDDPNRRVVVSPA